MKTYSIILTALLLAPLAALQAAEFYVAIKGESVRRRLPSSAFADAMMPGRRNAKTKK